MRNRDAQATHTNFRTRICKRVEVITRYTERHINTIHIAMIKCSIVYHRTEAMTDGISNHTIYLSIRAYVLKIVSVLHLIKTQLPRSKRPLVMKGCESKWCSEFTSEYSGSHTNIPHRNSDGWYGRIAHHAHDTKRVHGRVGQRGNFHDISIFCRQSSMYCV